METLEALRDRRVTGRSARLLMRFLGDLQIHRRNPYLFQELLDSAGRRERFFENTGKELAIVEAHAGGDPLVFRVLDPAGSCWPVSRPRWTAPRACAGA